MSHTTPPDDDELASLLSDPDARAWFETHRERLRENAYGQGFLYSVLVVTFIVGLGGYVAGYLLKSTGPTEPLALLADMLYTFGFALWTAAVIVVLLEIVPEAKRRQVRRALEVYEATRGTTARDGDNTTARDGDNTTARDRDNTTRPTG